MAGKETGKQRASRVPLDYYKRLDWIQRWKLNLTGLAVVLAIAWSAGSLLGGIWTQGNRTFSRGPVASVHSTWDAECSACHVSFKPMGENAGIGSLIGGTHASDALCQTCHAGPQHSIHEKQNEVQACATCHNDHRGPDASLVRMADNECTRCHTDLSLHVNASKGKPQYGNASVFALGKHPEFQAVRDGAKDPGKLSFNHKLHMSAGQVLTSGGKPFTLADIQDPSERERYRSLTLGGKADSAPIQLDCASCHRLDSGDFGIKQLSGLPTDAVLPPRAAGAFMQPITYDNQCKACHPLTVEKPGPDGKALAVPHRMQPDALHQLLTDAYVNQLLSGAGGKLLDEPLPKRLKPGESPELEKAKTDISARTLIAEKTLFAEHVLYSGKQTCGECHKYSTDTPLKDLRAGAAPTFRIEPPQVPTIWFKQARFNHSSHKALDCKACHARAYPDDVNASITSADVLVPGIENCVQCHAPRSGQRGGARFDCTECHNYHNGDRPLSGLGSVHRQPAKPLSIPQFLSGQP